MSHFSNNIRPKLSDISAALTNLKKIHDGPNPSSKNALADAKHSEDIIKQNFFLIEQMEYKKHLLETKANNTIHELEEELNALVAKFNRLEHFEREMNNNHLVLKQLEGAIFTMFKQGNLNQGVVNKINASITWLSNAVSVDKKDIIDVESELKVAQDRISKLQKHLHRED